MERSKQEKLGEDKWVSRREFLKMLIGGAASVLCFDLEKAIAKENTYEMPQKYENDWFFTPEKMKEIYDQEYNGEKVLKNRVFRAGDSWWGLVDSKEFKIPKEFFNITLSHLKAMLEQKTARYIFRLDAFHGHLFVPESGYSKYADATSVGEAHLLVNDRNLGILYHNSEHLQFNADPESENIRLKRNVIGWYDGRPIEVVPIPTKTKRTAADTPGHDLQPSFKFAANKDGEFSMNVDGKEIRLDFSFDDNTYY